MLFTDKVLVKVTGQTVRYYEELGYKIPKKPATSSSYDKYKKAEVYDYSKSILVDVKDLKSHSMTKVMVQCDNPDCRCLKIISYSDYTKNINNHNGLFLCSSCMVQRCNISENCWTEETRTKRINTNLKKYGFANPAQFPPIKAKQAKTMMERYGVSNPAQNAKLMQKIRNTMYQNGTAPTSTQQIGIYNRLKLLYPEAQINYPIGHKYSGDIVIDNLDIEVDYGGHNLMVKLGTITQAEFDRKQLIRDKIVKAEGYKMIRLIADKERKIPSDKTLLEILEISKQYFKDYPNHSWIEWHIDDGIYKNAEHKDGVPYDFGELRRIRKEDIA